MSVLIMKMTEISELNSVLYSAILTLFWQASLILLVLHKHKTVFETGNTLHLLVGTELYLTIVALDLFTMAQSMFEPEQDEIAHAQ